MSPSTSPDWNIEWIWAGAIVILAMALAYGMMRASRRTRAEKQMTEKAARKNIEEGG